MCTFEILSFYTVNSIISLPKGNVNKHIAALIVLMNKVNDFLDDEKENELKFPNC